MELECPLIYHPRQTSQQSGHAKGDRYVKRIHSSRLLQVVQNVTVRSFSSAPKYTIKHEHVSRRDNRADVGHLKPAPSEGLTYLGSQRQARPLRAALGKLDQRKQPRDDTQHSNHRDSKWKNKKENLKQL